MPRAPFAGIVAALVLLAGPLRAADTVETWDAGAIDVDAYVGVEGLGESREERVLYLDAMLGYGLVDRLSVYAGSTQTTDDDSIYLGVFGTLIDGDAVDLDLFLDFSFGGDAYSDATVTPALELNVDADPARGSWGVYLCAGLPVTSGTGEEQVPELTHALEWTSGAYLTIAEGHMLFVEHDMVWERPASSERRPPEHASVAAGYNVTLGPTTELVNELRVAPSSSKAFGSVGLMTGVILTLD